MFLLIGRNVDHCTLGVLTKHHPQNVAYMSCCSYQTSTYPLWAPFKMKMLLKATKSQFEPAGEFKGQATLTFLEITVFPNTPFHYVSADIVACAMLCPGLHSSSSYLFFVWG